MTDTPRPDRTLEEIAAWWTSLTSGEKWREYADVRRRLAVLQVSSVQARTREAVRDEGEQDYRRTVVSIATMLGWENVPPQRIIEADIAALKARVATLAGEKLQAEAQLATVRADTETAAGELLVPMPEPGTDMARLLIANRLLRQQRATVRRDTLREVLSLPFRGALVPPTGPYILVSDLTELHMPARADEQEPQP